MKTTIFFIMIYIITLNNVCAQKFPYEVARSKANHVVHNFHEIMKDSIKRNFKNGGILEAAKFCANKSSKVIERFNDELEEGISLKRISLRNRNPNAYPQKDEVEILKAFDLLEKSSVYLPSIVQVVDEDIYKVYFSATMSKRSCKQCHGLEQNTNPQVIKLIKKKYPKDKAFGFKAGEVRGAVVVTVKIKY